MNSNEQIKKAYAIVTAIVLVVVAVSIWSIINIISSPTKKNVDDTNKNIGVNKDLFDQISSPSQNKAEVSTNENGYGRNDPFSPY
jgi:hypothetical protein